MSKQLVAWIFGMLSLLSACGPETIFVRPHLDTASQHITSGNSLLERGKIDDACREFTRAGELDPQNALARAGMGIALIHKGDLENALKSLDRAKNMAADKQEFDTIQKGYEQYYEALRLRQGDDQ